ncbi:MAG: group 1 truncated hemoglobin [Halobacteriovoraceae bacterium]|jgi:truncated hemoglobin YjbI|nr:group 1 truncated hemoglobin [Halobacteriovoraceae bacterium]MBT5094026.1 group 1 truncated hemoglobin [Halobacteriovoraceae bacterium]
MSGQTIYEKYGGFEFWHHCIYDLYLDMFDHPEISYHFIGVNIITLSTHQAQFLSPAIGGPVLYKGPPMKLVHKDLDISEFQFAEIAKAFAQVFRDNGVEEKDVLHIMKFVGSFQKAITSSKVNLIDEIMRPFYSFVEWLTKFGKAKEE